MGGGDTSEVVVQVKVDEFYLKYIYGEHNIAWFGNDEMIIDEHYVNGN